MPEVLLDAVFSALSDPTRRAILARLAYGEAPVLELARPFDISQPAISRHLKVLEQAGLIERRREAQRRLCRLIARPLEEAARWLEDYRQSRADGGASDPQKPPGKKRKKKKKREGKGNKR